MKPASGFVLLVTIQAAGLAVAGRDVLAAGVAAAVVTGLAAVAAAMGDRCRMPVAVVATDELPAAIAIGRVLVAAVDIATTETGMTETVLAAIMMPAVAREAEAATMPIAEAVAMSKAASAAIDERYAAAETAAMTRMSAAPSGRTCVMRAATAVAAEDRDGTCIARTVVPRLGGCGHCECSASCCQPDGAGMASITCVSITCVSTSVTCLCEMVRATTTATRVREAMSAAVMAGYGNCATNAAVTSVPNSAAMTKPSVAGKSAAVSVHSGKSAAVTKSAVSGKAPAMSAHAREPAAKAATVATHASKSAAMPAHAGEATTKALAAERCAAQSATTAHAASAAADAGLGYGVLRCRRQCRHLARNAHARQCMCSWHQQSGDGKTTHPKNCVSTSHRSSPVSRVGAFLMDGWAPSDIGAKRAPSAPAR